MIQIIEVHSQKVEGEWEEPATREEWREIYETRDHLLEAALMAGLTLESRLYALRCGVPKEGEKNARNGQNE